MPARIPKPVVVQDTREKNPWDFSDDAKFAAVKVEKLDYGDYSIEGLEDVVVIERKADANELFQNFAHHRTRLEAEFERMRDCMVKFIVIEQTLEDLLRPENYFAIQQRRVKTSTNPRFAPALVINALQEAAMIHNIHIIFAGKKAKSMARGLLLKAYELHRKGKLHAQRSGTEEIIGS